MHLVCRVDGVIGVAAREVALQHCTELLCVFCWLFWAVLVTVQQDMSKQVRVPYFVLAGARITQVGLAARAELAAL